MRAVAASAVMTGFYRALRWRFASPCLPRTPHPRPMSKSVPRVSTKRGRAVGGLCSRTPIFAHPYARPRSPARCLHTAFRRKPASIATATFHREATRFQRLGGLFVSVGGTVPVPAPVPSPPPPLPTRTLLLCGRGLDAVRWANIWCSLTGARRCGLVLSMPWSRSCAGTDTDGDVRRVY